MTIIFRYEHEEIEITPIEIRFYQKEHAFGQLYVLVPSFITNPKRAIMKDVFDGFLS